MTDESTKYLDFIFVRMEAEIREKIAKEIEAQIESLSLDDGLFKSGMIGAAAIARGNNE
jgi:hypothetical protein